MKAGLLSKHSLPFNHCHPERREGSASCPASHSSRVPYSCRPLLRRHAWASRPARPTTTLGKRGVILSAAKDLRSSPGAPQKPEAHP